MNSFIYDIPVKVYFGKSQLEGNLGKELKKFGSRVLLTYGGGSIKKGDLYCRVISEIKKADMELFELSGIEPNPRITSVNEGVRICKEKKIDVLLAVGGGSTIDCTKFIASGTFYDGDAWDLITGKGEITKSLPIITVLTLSATGSEMDSGGVISNMDTKDKLGFGHPSMLPKISFLEPENTYSVNLYQTACGSVDIMSHIFEVYFNMNQDLYMLDCFAEGLLKTVIKYGPIALKEPANYEARANLMWASSWAINGFLNGGKKQAWSCHPMQHELSAIYDITHGLGLAILTPRWMEYTLSEKTVSKFFQFGTNVFDLDPKNPPMEVAKESIKKLSEFFFVTMGLKSTLREVGIDNKNFSLMAKKACMNDTISGFIPLKAKDIEAIYEMCF